MAATLAGVSLSSATRVVSMAAETPKQQPAHGVLFPWKACPRASYSSSRRLLSVGPARNSPTPPGISEKVEESIKAAEEACAGEPATGECAAAWDEVEELSAAAGHAREKLKANSDPLENYCKENPETDECRTYDD